MIEKLSAGQIDESLRRLPEWRLEDGSIVRHLTFVNFSDAMVFVNRIAEIAEEEGHHPEINIVYNRVTLGLTTHDAGGLTAKDFQVAQRFDALLTSLTHEDDSDFA